MVPKMSNTRRPALMESLTPLVLTSVPHTMTSAIPSLLLQSSVVPVPQEFWYRKDLMVLNEPESAPRSLWPPLDNEVGWFTNCSSPSLTINEEGLSPPIQHVEEHSDSNTELSVPGSPIYSRRLYSLLQMQLRQDTRPLPSNT